MRTFKINTRSYPNSTGLTKRQRQAKLAEGVDKAKLRRSGLWDNAAASKSTLVITRINRETA